MPEPAEYIAHLTDAHTHLASCGARDAATVAEFVTRAHTAGLERICTVGDGLAEAELALAAAESHPDVVAACAIHPTKARELDDAARARLREMAAHPKCVAIGETGLDTYWIRHRPDDTAPLAVQEEALRFHIDVAVAAEKALMIHNREADADLLRVLGDAPSPKYTILHCFSSPTVVAEEAIARGYVLSFAGNVTFKNNEELRQIAAMVPIDQLLIETDAPFMTPVPYRGAKNEPAFIGHTALCVAAARSMPVAKLAEAVAANFDRVYQIAKP